MTSVKGNIDATASYAAIRRMALSPANRDRAGTVFTVVSADEHRCDELAGRDRPGAADW
jgi:hypothetical protein